MAERYLTRLCSECGLVPPRGPSKRLCEECVAEQAWLRLIKGRCRAYTRKLIERGKIERKPCIFCGEPDTEAHHPNYNNPFQVAFLCAPHHREWHEQGRRIEAEARRAA